MSYAHPAHHAASRARSIEECWAGAGGVLFALATLLAMASSAHWNVAMMLLDPLVWMMMLLAAAVGLVFGYALGVRVHWPVDD